MNVDRVFFILLCFFSAWQCPAQVNGWRIAGDRITTPWAAKVDPTNPLPEYPRPQLVRESWMNLNGLWDFVILPRSENIPGSYEGKILVPFPAESALSGVNKTVGSENRLWYRRTFTLPASFRNKRTLLHFGAVDWQCDVFVNGTKVGSHQGGFDPFSFDITAHLKRSGAQELTVAVWDPTDEGPQPRGKQVNKPHSIWYTPVTGIWQTVWVEAVPETYIERTRHAVDLEDLRLSVKAVLRNAVQGDVLSVSAFDGERLIGEAQSSSDSVVLEIANPKLWSPENPFLYDLKIAVMRKGKIIDEVRSYFAMRKISMEADNKGIQRMMLNNEFLFQYGPLDQGWWPDGLYTAPTDEALRFDIEKTKAMGFNMIRKHVKVEPDRWYYHCDRLGMLVWQDMPSGDLGNRWESRPGIIGIATERERTPESERIFRTEWKAIMDSKMNFPSIVVWVPFNEAWGQFKTEEIVKWTMAHDPTRLVNAASGGNFVPVGHIIDLHNYPAPCMPDPSLYGEQIIVLGEFGGLGLPVEGHTWQSKDNWGYRSFSTTDELLNQYRTFIEKLPELIELGLSAAVYTQTTDVEIEVNGLITYDRKVVKMPERTLKEIHAPLYKVPGVK